jgi:hypothetical protein
VEISKYRGIKMKDIILCLIGGIILLVTYRLGFSDGAKNNTKSPLKAVNEVINKAVHHKEIAKVEQEEKQKKKLVNDIMAYDVNIAMNTVKREAKQ